MKLIKNRNRPNEILVFNSWSQGTVNEVLFISCTMKYLYYTGCYFNY